MNTQILADTFVGSLSGLWASVLMYVPNILMAIIIFLIGWLVGAALQQLVEQIFKSLKLDSLLKNTGLSDAVERAGYQLNSGKFIGTLCNWFVIAAFAMVSLDILGLNEVTAFVGQVATGFIPNVIKAALIILVGALAAQVVSGVVSGSARAAGVHSAGVAGVVAKYAVWIFVIITAVEQLNIETTFLQTLYTGVVVAISLALGLAFGLGGQEAAGRFIEKARTEIMHK